MPVWTPFFATPGGSIFSPLGSPTGEYLLTGLLRSALRALACKSCACRPWQARSPGQGSPGVLAPRRLLHPRTTASLSLRAQSKEPQERAPRTSVQGGTYAASARLHGRRTTAGMQELEQRRSGCRGRAAPGAVAEGRTGAACAPHVNLTWGLGFAAIFVFSALDCSRG